REAEVARVGEGIADRVSNLAAIAHRVRGAGAQRIDGRKGDCLVIRGVGEIAEYGVASRRHGEAGLRGDRIHLTVELQNHRRIQRDVGIAIYGIGTTQGRSSLVVAKPRVEVVVHAAQIISAGILHVIRVAQVDDKLSTRGERLAGRNGRNRAGGVDRDRAWYF